MEIDPPDHTSQAENAYQEQTDIDQPEASQVENDYQDLTEGNQPEMRQGENDYQEVQRHNIDQTEIEISQEVNIDNQEVQRLGVNLTKVQCLSAKLINGAQKTKFFFSSPCIYRVPNELRKLKESAYTPRLIAIGPLHRSDPNLQTPMRHVKICYANYLVCRVSEVMEGQESAEQKNLTVLRECMEAIEASLDDAKKCYQEEVTLDVEMMLVDGCFILEFLYRYFWRDKEMAADPIFVNDSTLMMLEHDLLLLENQIPFFVLERLFSLTLARIPNRPNKKLSLTDYVRLPKVDQLMRPQKVSSEQEVSSGNATGYHHLLHKLHNDYLPQDPPKKAQGDLTKLLPSASELVYAGVKFIRGTGDDLFKVKFIEPEGLFWWCHRACFEIPFLLVDDSTESFLRNLIAFEQCCPGQTQHFTSYAMLMDMLVNYDKDVQQLEKAGVLCNYLGAAKDVTELFNKLSKEVSYGEFFFADTCNRAIRYRKHFWPKNMATVRGKYFASPWAFIAFCLGFIYFCITITKFIRGFLT